MSISGHDAFWRKLFLSAACFNWIAAAGFVLIPPGVMAGLGVRPVAEPALYLHLFAAAVALFGYGYYLVGRDLGERVVVRLGAIGKLLVFALISGNWLLGLASWHLPALATIDFVYAILFLVFLRQGHRTTRGLSTK